jgi:hypothetical protein
MVVGTGNLFAIIHRLKAASNSHFGFTQNLRHHKPTSIGLSLSISAFTSAVDLVWSAYPRK